METVPAILWRKYLMLAGISDNVFKPILLPIGAPVPMLVVFLGVIGGFVLSGFIGLFTGSIVPVLVTYYSLNGWIRERKLMEQLRQYHDDYNLE